MNQWYVRGYKRNHVFHIYTSFFHVPFTLNAENEAAGSNIHRHGSGYHKTHILQHRHNLTNNMGGRGNLSMCIRNSDAYVLCLEKCRFFIFFLSLHHPNKCFNNMPIFYLPPLPLLSYAYGLQKHILLTGQNTAEQSRMENNST